MMWFWNRRLATLKGLADQRERELVSVLRSWLRLSPHFRVKGSIAPRFNFLRQITIAIAGHPDGPTPPTSVERIWSKSRSSPSEESTGSCISELRKDLKDLETLPKPGNCTRAGGPSQK